MKFLLLALFVAAATAAPQPLEEEIGEPVEVIINGLPEGEALEIGDIVDIKLNQHVDGELASATNLLHPYTAVGIAEAAAAAAAAAPEPVHVVDQVGYFVDESVIPEPVVLPEPVAPEVVIPEPVVLPEPVAPEVVIPEPVVLPEPVAPEVVLPVVPEPVVLPEPVAPEVVLPVVPEPVVLPEPVAPEQIPVPAPQIPGEVYNDGLVQVTVNTPETGVIATLQSWFNLVLNYINNGIQTTQQII